MLGIVSRPSADWLTAYGAVPVDDERDAPDLARGREGPRRTWRLPVSLGSGALLVAAGSSPGAAQPAPGRRGLDSAEGPGLPGGGAGAEEVTPTQPGPGQLLER